MSRGSRQPDVARAGGAAQADDSGTNVRPLAAALAEEADYDGATLDRARDLLVRRTIGAASSSSSPVLRDVVERVRSKQRRGRADERLRFADEEKAFVAADAGTIGIRSRG